LFGVTTVPRVADRTGGIDPVTSFKAADAVADC